MADVNVQKLGLTQHTEGADSTNDISADFTVSECVCDGIFFQKPLTTDLTISLANPQVDSALTGATISLVSSLVADAETSGFRASKVPILDGATITVTTTGSVSGTKRVDFAFRVVRQGA